MVVVKASVSSGEVFETKMNLIWVCTMEIWASGSKRLRTPGVHTWFRPFTFWHTLFCFSCTIFTSKNELWITDVDHASHLVFQSKGVKRSCSSSLIACPPKPGLHYSTSCSTKSFVCSPWESWGWGISPEDVFFIPQQPRAPPLSSFLISLPDSLRLSTFLPFLCHFLSSGTKSHLFFIFILIAKPFNIPHLYTPSQCTSRLFLLLSFFFFLTWLGISAGRPLCGFYFCGGDTPPPLVTWCHSGEEAALSQWTGSWEDDTEPVKVTESRKGAGREDEGGGWGKKHDTEEVYRWQVPSLGSLCEVKKLQKPGKESFRVERKGRGVGEAATAELVSQEETAQGWNSFIFHFSFFNGWLISTRARMLAHAMGRM